MSARGERRRARRQRGMVMISSLLLLLVVTLLAVAMFRSMGIDAKIAGNVREKQRALHAAESAQQYAEYWLSSGSNASIAPITCNSVVNANQGFGQICSNIPVSATNQTLTAGANFNPVVVPWTISGTPVGVTYTPSGMNATGVTQANTYYLTPSFYISYLGGAADGLGTVYQIDAVGYGGTADAVSVVESTYETTPSVVNRGGL